MLVQLVCMTMDPVLLVSHVLMHALLVMPMVVVNVVVTELKMKMTNVSVKVDIMKIPNALAHHVTINVTLVLIHQLVILVPVTDLKIPHLVLVTPDIMITVPTMLFVNNVLLNVLLVPHVTDIVILVLKTDQVLQNVTVMTDSIYLVMNVYHVNMFVKHVQHMMFVTHVLLMKDP